MRVVAKASIFLSLLLFLAIQSSNALPFNRTLFPSSFIFGAGSAAYQLEGGTGFWTFKGPSIWDTFTHKHPEKIDDRSNGDVAEDFYNRYKDDIKLMKQIGLDSFRFSISWSRIFPKGRGVPNYWGVRFYNNVINELLANGITPFVTLFHWDLPQALEDEYGGFLSRKVVEDFQDYAEFCFKTFGDRVKHWATMNEPYIFTTKGYNVGTMAPGRCSNYEGNCTHGDSSTEPYIVSHNMLLSHAAVYRLYKTQFQDTQKGEIGITLNTNWYEPKNNTFAHVVAANRAIDFAFGWHAHPITYGDYPQNMKLFVGDRLPKFTKFESELLKKSYDFIGINYYTSSYAESARYTTTNKSFTSDQQLNLTYWRGDNVSIGTPTDLKWLYICPEGLHKLMVYIKDRYQNPQIYITENGVADTASKPLVESLNDTIRITYIEGHLKNILQSIKDGVNVKGYFIWSFLDDFEWASGYTVRFGITYVDYKNNLKRYLKASAKWLKKFLFIRRVINQVIDQPLEQEVNY